MSIWFVVMVPTDGTNIKYCYGPYSEKDAKADYNTRIAFYGEQYKIYLTRVENES